MVAPRAILSPSKMPSIRRIAMAFAGAAVIAWMTAASAGAAGGLDVEPPARNALKCIKQKQPPALSRDWQKWQGGKLDVSADDALSIARAYANGTDTIDPDPMVARRILEAIVDKPSRATPDARKALAKIDLTTPGADPSRVDGAVKQLEQAVKERDSGAAVTLGQFYEEGQLVGRDPVKALSYYRIGATVGDPQGLLGIARLAKAGAIPNLAAGQADELTRQAIIALLTDVGRGNCESLYWLGLLYEIGDIAPQNLALAARWYESAALVAGHAKAAERLAQMYATGNGVELSQPKRFEFLQIAAKGGRPRSMLNLGEAFALGDGTNKNSDQAIFWFDKADRSGEDNSLRWLARAWRGEFGGKVDLVKSFNYLKRDTERPTAERRSFYELGMAYVQGQGTKPDIDAGLVALKHGAELGYKDAAEAVGDIYRQGQGGIAADPLRAARYYRMAAAFGNVGAMKALYEMSRCGIGVTWSVDVAQRWAERAAFLGSGSSMYDYALSLPNNDDPANQTKRFLLLRHAADLGSREAMVLVSFAYRNGTGIAADPGEADLWLNQALADGPDQVRGYIALAAAYREGNGVPRDLDKARSLLQESANKGQPRGIYELMRFVDAYDDADPADLRQRLTAAAVAGHPAAMRTIASELGQGEVIGGKDAAGWMKAAAGAGEVRAKIAMARRAGSPDGVETQLDRIALDGACEPDQMTDLGLAYYSVSSGDAQAKGKTWLERAAVIAGDDPNVLFTLGKALAAGVAGDDQRQKGLDLLSRVANSGMLKAMRVLADGYGKGDWGTVDRKLALQWMTKAAEAGDGNSAVDYAKLATSGKPDPAEVEKAHAFLVKAAANSSNAARQLGLIALRGVFGQSEANRAAYWLEKAAAEGNSRAMLDLANALATGEGGVARDPSKAVEWLRKGAEAGDGKAMFQLAAAYEAGFGTATDASAAAHWYQASREAQLETGQ